MGQIKHYLGKSSWYGMLYSESRIELCNPALMELLGQHYPEGLEDIFGDGSERVRSLLEEAQQKNKQVSTGLQADFGNGLVPIFIEATCITDEDKQIFVIFFRPVFQLCRLMKSQLIETEIHDGEEIIRRMKSCLGIKSNRRLAKWLGVRESAVSAVIGGREVPFKWRCMVCEQTGVSYHWLMYGMGEGLRF